MSSTQYDDAILDSNAIDPTDKNGNPIPVTIPIMLAPGIKVVYTTRLGGDPTARLFLGDTFSYTSHETTLNHETRLTPRDALAQYLASPESLRDLGSCAR